MMKYLILSYSLSYGLQTTQLLVM